MNKYKVILDVVKTGSFSKTAQNLSYSQSAISQTIKLFESEIGFPIFKRTNTGVQLIPAAQEVINSLNAIEKEQEKLQQISDAMTKETSGKVRLGLFFSFATTTLPNLLKKFQETYPEIEFEIFTGNQKEIHDLLEKGAIDIAISSENSLREFEYTNFLDDEFLIVLPLEHPLSKQPTISVYELKDMNYILSGEKFKYEIGDIFKSTDVKPKIKLELFDEMVALRFIEAGFGISVFSKYFLDSIPNHANVVRRPFTEHYYRSLVLATNPNHYISASARLFLKYLKEEMNI